MAPSPLNLTPFALLVFLCAIAPTFASEPLSDKELDSVNAGGVTGSSQLQRVSAPSLSAKELEAVDGQGWGGLSLGWPLVVGFNEGWVLPPVENAVSLPPRPPSNIGLKNTGISWARPYANSR